LKKSIGISNYIIKTIAPLFYYACIKNKLDYRIIRLNKEIKIFDFIKRFPFFYTQYLLFKGLNESLDHKITSNDVYDIRSYSFTLPYCDYVAGERYVISLAKRNEINKIYSTGLFTKSNIEDIEVKLDDLIY